MRAQDLGFAIAALLMWSFADRADAADRHPGSLELGARTGFGLPLGSSTGASGDDFNKVIRNMVPIWLDAGFRFTPNWYFGAYFMYGFGSPPSSLSTTCDLSGVSCSFHDARLGADLQYHGGQGKVDPWVGLGTGFEWYGFDASQGNQSAGVGASGWEFLNIQIGLDYKPVAEFGIGPFLALTLAQFDHASLAGTGVASQSQSISNQALHEWFVVGVRGVFDVLVTPPEPVKPAE